MKHHTFVVGTSKSKEKDAYYIQKSNWFWGLLFDEGVTEELLKPTDYRTLGREYGIYLTEIVDPDDHIVAQDGDITGAHVRNGMESLMRRIEEHEPRRIGFKGKNAATWFYRYFEDKPLTASGESDHNADRRRLDYGPLDWEYLGLEYYLLTSLRAYHFDEDNWRSFWQRVKSDVEQFQ